MSDTKSNPQFSSNMPAQFDREAELARMAERVAKVQAEHPDQDLKASTQWWTPVIDLKENMQDLDPETNQKVNDAARRVLESKFDPEVMKIAREELETLLSGKHEDILESVKSTIFANQDALAGMREHIQKNLMSGFEIKVPVALGGEQFYSKR